MTITEHSPIDAETLDTMVQLEVAVVPPRGKEESEILRQTRERLSHEAGYPEAWAFIGTIDNKPIGFVFGFPATYEKERDGTPDRERTEFLSSLVVLPDFQSDGHGTELLRLAERHAARLGRSTVALFTAETNQGARRLYEREGWRAEQTTERDANGSTYKIVHYAKNLEAQAL